MTTDRTMTTPEEERLRAFVADVARLNGPRPPDDWPYEQRQWDEKQRAALLACARAQAEALRETRCTFEIKRCANGRYADDRSFWCDLCIRQAAAEALVAELEK